MEIPLPENLSAAIQELVRGQESAKKLRQLLSTSFQQLKGEADLDVVVPPPSAASLVGDVLRSFTSILSILNSGESIEVSQAPAVNDRCIKSEDSEESSKSSAPRDRRGCYKRRKSSDTRTKFSSTLTDDGYQWRKYGQKAILNTDFPRSYFRCTHKLDQGCLATKQVQKISNVPPTYKTFYNGEHTCMNLLKAPQTILDSSPRRDSSFILSFKTNNNDIPFSARSSSSLPSVIKREAKEEITPHGRQMTMSHNYQSSNSSEYCLHSTEPTMFESTFQSDHAEVRSSSYCSFEDSDLIDLDGVFSSYQF